MSVAVARVGGGSMPARKASSEKQTVCPGEKCQVMVVERERRREGGVGKLPAKAMSQNMHA